MKITVSLGKGEFGTEQPRIDISTTGETYRALSATVHRIAAEIEMAARESDLWSVDMTAGDRAGRVWLDLARGDNSEIKRAMDVMREVAKKF